MHNDHASSGDGGYVTRHRVVQCERRERPLDPGPRPPAHEEDRGPQRPKSGSPEKDELLKRMRRVDPKQAERYRQRTGQ